MICCVCDSTGIFLNSVDRYNEDSEPDAVTRESTAAPLLQEAWDKKTQKVTVRILWFILSSLSTFLYK